MSPVVGVTSIPRRSRTVFAELPHETAPEPYLAPLVRFGAVPVVVPVHAEPAEELLSRLEGLVLTGGGDVDPARYGDAVGPETHGIDERRDRLEIELVRQAVELDRPVLALCRGIQVLNVALGGTLIQDIRSEVPDALDHWDLEHWNGHSHAVRFERSSRLATLIGEEVSVNSMHHQAVGDSAEALVPVGRAPDGVVEAVEAPDLRFCVGLQWHAECLGDASSRVFEEFVAAAREVRV